MIEHFFICPYCGEEISMLIDPSVKQQNYIEDCQVCCNPIEIDCSIRDNNLENFSAKPT
ncbi:MAG TPA: CPXCG motif-containing cysteine-rich protein [Cyclobacteriaceae bacterium]